MNKQRREALSKLHGQLDDLKAEVEGIRDDEQEAFDNMPESFQNGDRGADAQGSIDQLEEGIAAADEMLAALDGAQE